MSDGDRRRAIVERRLHTVRRRQRIVSATRAAAWGLLAGSLAALLLVVWQLAFEGAARTAALSQLVAVGVAAGAIVGASWPRSLVHAARSIDRHYELKDRVTSALAFTRRAGDAIYDLQLRDAEAHLAQVDARRVVPLGWPRALPYAVAALILTIGVGMWPSGAVPAAAEPTPPLPQAVAVAAVLKHRLEALNRIAEAENSEELEGLVEQLRGLVEALDEPGVDHREALATLSEMEAAVAAQQAEFNVDLVDRELEDLAEALAVTDATEAAAAALEAGQLEKAADELEGIEAESLDERETAALEDALEDVAASMEEAGLEEWADAVGEMAEGAKKGDGQQMGAGADRMGDLVRSHAQRKRINQLLSAELAGLSESKSGLEGDGEGSKDGGDNANRSNRPSDQWGRGVAGNEGEKTEIDSQRVREQLTGQLGEGPSEVEITRSPEARQEATRAYRESYEEYQKLSEAVLQTEPLPLGHRQTIRRYFELIRPTDADESPADRPNDDAGPATESAPDGKRS